MNINKSVWFRNIVYFNYIMIFLNFIFGNYLVAIIVFVITITCVTIWNNTRIGG